MSENYQKPAPVAQTSTPAVISLISGILSWLGVFGLGGILAVIFGHVAKKEIRNSGGYLTGDGMATAGLILGYANIALSLIGFCLFLLVMIGAISAPLVCLPFSNQFNVDFSMIP